jgi:hypothetical protein
MFISLWVIDLLKLSMKREFDQDKIQQVSKKRFYQMKTKRSHIVDEGEMTVSTIYDIM